MSRAFFHKGISRFQAEVFLTDAKDDGSFLVRDSESLPGAYVLCLLDQLKVHQYRVLPGPDGKLHVQSETGTIQRGYNDLTELIAEYIKKQGTNGLAAALVHPIAPEGSSEDLDMSDDDDDDDDDDEDNFECPPPVVSPPATPTEKKTNGHPEPGDVDLAKNFATLDLKSCDAEFTKTLKDYVEQGYKKDSVSMNVGDSELHEFTNVLEVAAGGIKRELDSFMKKMNILNDFLKVDRQKHSTLESRHRVSGTGLPNLLEQMSRVRSEVLNIQTKAQETIQLASLPSDYEYLDAPDGIYCENGITSGPFLASTYRPYIPQSKFEVKKVKHGHSSKLTLTVDLQNGKYSILKQTGKESLATNTISHDRILHLIKCTKDKCILDVILDGKKKQTYVFADHHTRENFCLQIRQMKNMHSTETEIDQISMFIGTWNMGDASLNQSLSTWLKCTGSGKCRDRVLGVIPHDMYVIGTQESSMTEKDWVNTLKAGLKACVLVDMELLEVCTLWGIRLAILVKPEYKPCISRIQRSSVRTGIANALGNKGAVAISFYFNGTSFCFINAHLTSGDERCNRRNQNYRDIMKNLTVSLGQKHLGLFDVTNQFQHVFWLGDLNYRVEEDIQVLLHKVQEKDINFLMQKDQLKRLQRQKTAFCGFQESEITFLPTYRLERNIPGYRYSWKKMKRTGEKINAPSWCDRVLWKSYPGVFIENVAYGSSEAILSSDHRPVFSSFNVGISSEFVEAARGSLAEMAPVKIIFHSIEAQVKTCCKQYFQLVFHSTCLQDVYKSQSNTSFLDNRTGFFTVPVWHASNLPEMKPLFGDQDFLEEQHILIAVIAKDGDNESYGECVLSLQDMLSSQPKDFEYSLLHQGEETGKIKGKMQIVSKSKRSSKKSPYSLMAFDTEYQDPEMFVSGTPKSDLRSNIRPGSKSGSFVLKQPGVNPKMPLRQACSYQDGRGSYDKLPLTTRELARSTKVDSRAPHPLPTQGSSSQPVPPPRRPPVMGQTGLMQGSQRALPRQPATSSAPPVPPKHRPSVSGGDHLTKYEDLKRPLSVEEWLAQLNLSFYEQNFISNGWESLLYLNELTLNDLNNMGVEIPEHQLKIVQSIRELNKQLRPHSKQNHCYEGAKRQYGYKHRGSGMNQTPSPSGHQHRGSGKNQTPSPSGHQHRGSGMNQTPSPSGHQHRGSGMTQTPSPSGHQHRGSDMTQTPSPSGHQHRGSGMTQTPSPSGHQHRGSGMTQTPSPSGHQHRGSGMTQTPSPSGHQHRGSGMNQTPSPSGHQHRGSGMNQTPSPSGHQHHGSGMNQTPSSSGHQHRGSGMNQTPSSSGHQHRGSGMNQTPSPSGHQHRGSGMNQTPSPSGHQHRGSGMNQTPSPSGHQHRGSGMNQTPSPSGHQHRGSGMNQTPSLTGHQHRGSGMTQTPSPSGYQHRGSGMNQTPSPLGHQHRGSGMNQTPSPSGHQQHGSGMTQTPSPSGHQHRGSGMNQTPSPSGHQHRGSGMNQTPSPSGHQHRGSGMTQTPSPLGYEVNTDRLHNGGFMDNKEADDSETVDYGCKCQIMFGKWCKGRNSQSFFDYVKSTLLTELSSIACPVAAHIPNYMAVVPNDSKETRHPRGEPVTDSRPKYQVLEQQQLEDDDDIEQSEVTPAYAIIEEPLYHEIEVTTVEEWLLALGLSCYIETFKDHGWENLLVLDEMTAGDLDKMGIKNVTDRSLILNSVADFKKC